MEILPSNLADWPRQPSPWRRRAGTGLKWLLAMVAVGGLLGVLQTFVGLERVVGEVVSIASNAHLPGSDRPESRNWAGYAVTGGTYTAVSGTWSVPRFAADSPAGADAIWVGIGGVRGSDLIQAGTQETVSGHGSTQYEAWVETLPEASRPVPLAVSAGDSVTISLQQQAGDQWLVMFVNNTSGKSYQLAIRYASSRSSVEWIVEAPTVRRGRLVPLDTFGSVVFTQASTVKNGETETIAQAGGHPITMIGQRRQTLAHPSELDQDGAGFNVLE